MKPLERASMFVGVVVGALTILGWANNALIEHLDQTFATKQDVIQIEHKIDIILQRVDELKENEHGRKR